MSNSFEGLEFYRCKMCGTVVSDWDIYREPHGCPKCGCTKMLVTNLSFIEKLIQVVKHPKVWRWNDVSYVRGVTND